MLLQRGVTVSFLLACSAILAQGPAATISGTITDPSSAAIAEAAVEVHNVGTGSRQTFASDAQGRFRVPDLGLGDYEVQVTKTGFQTVVRKGITLTVGSQTVVDFAMQVGQTQQTLTVEGQVAQVETQSSAVSNLVEATQMRELPLNGRNFAQLLTLAPGVQQLTQQASQRYGTQANYSVAGSRGEGQLFLLDNTNTAGFFNHGTGSGATGTSLGVEAIAEFQTLINTYSAQYGGNGAVVNAVTKSGTNSIHGSAYEFLRNSQLDARNFFDTFRRPGSTEALVPSFRRNQFGGSVGGAIKKDKAFFFMNYEGIRQLLGQTQPAVAVPDANARNGIINGVNIGVSPLIASSLALFPAAPAGVTSTSGIVTIAQVANQVVHENYYLWRFDYTLSEKDSLFLRYVFDKGQITSPFAQGALPLWPEEDSTANHYLTVEEKRIISPTLINLARVSFVRPQELGTVNTKTAPIQYYGASGFDGRVNIGGLASLGPGGTVPFGYIPNHFVYADDVLLTKGSHSIRFGISADRIRYATNNPFQLGGQYTFTGLTTFLQGISTQFAGPLPGQSDSIRDYRELLITPYIHDEWKATSRLTVNLGVRYDWAANPSEARHGLTTIVNPPFGAGFEKVSNIFISNPTSKNFAPRVGLAFDPFRDHKTSIRAGFGMFYNTMLAREYIFGFSLAPPFALGSKGNPTYGPAFAGGGNPNLPALNSGQDYRINVTPYMMQYNFNLQRQFGANILSIGYVGSAGVHLLSNREENPPTPVIDANGVYHFADLLVTATKAPCPANPTASQCSIFPHAKLNPVIGPLPIKRADAHSNYNSLQIGLNRRFTKGLQAQVSYTYSKSMDNSSQSNGLESSNSSNTQMNPYEPYRERGRSDFDRGQAFRISGVYALPFRGNQLSKGWQVSGIFSAASGPPFTMVTGFDQTGFLQNFAGRPNLNPGFAPNAFKGLATQWYAPAAFTLNPVGTFGNLGRNTGFGPDLVNTDFALLKDTKIAKISEAFNVQFRAEMFNIFNHTNLGLPNLNVFTGGTNGGGNLNPNAGRITTTTTTSRQIQLALKFVF